MPEKTPADRGRRLIDALIVWITPSPPEPGINRFEARVSGGWRHMARTVCGREDRANRSPAWTRRERCGRPRPCRTRHRAPRAGRGCGRMRQVGVHHHDPVEPVACDTLEDATVQIGPGPSAHLDVHGQGPTSRAETTGVSSSESSSTSSSSHAMARPAMAPVTRSAKQLKARGLSQRRHRDLQRRVVVRSGKAASCRAFETRRAAWQAAGGRRGAAPGGGPVRESSLLSCFRNEACSLAGRSGRPPGCYDWRGRSPTGRRPARRNSSQQAPSTRRPTSEECKGGDHECTAATAGVGRRRGRR